MRMIWSWMIMNNLEETENQGNEGLLETLVFLGAVATTYTAGALDGVWSLLFTLVATAGWFWLMGLSVPGKDNDNGLL